MNKLKALLLGASLVTLSACSTVVITDGASDQLIGSGVDTGCTVEVSKDFKGTLTYKSEACEIHITEQQ